MIKNLSSRQECFVSVVTVLQAHKPDKARLKAMLDHLAAHFTDYEIVLVQNSLPVGWDIENDILNALPSIRYLQLSHPVHPDVALAASVENAIGDYVVILSERDPIEAIANSVQLCRGEADIVIGVTEYRSSLGYRMVRPLIQEGLRRIGYDLPRGATSFRCLSRRAVNAVIRTGRFHHQFFMRVQKTGFHTATYAYKTLAPESAPVRTLMQGIQDALRLFVFNSTKPLRWMSMLGLVGSFMSFIFAAYSLLINLFKRNVVEGWTTIVLFNSFLFMVLFVMMAFFGEYLGRLLDERGDQRDYAVAFEKISSVMINPSRINVLQESTGDHDATFLHPKAAMRS